MSGPAPRVALLVSHSGRPRGVTAARRTAERLGSAGFTVRVLADEAGELAVPGAETVADGPTAAAGAEIVVALGGDGTFLRAAEAARPVGVPLLGVNLGRVGFLAEVETADLDAALRQVVDRGYDIDERMTLDVTVEDPGGATVARTWALNEAGVEKRYRERMLEVLVTVDGRPLSRYGCDGVICATPTGSTAYAFSAGGPVVWPGVEAMLLVPISAHALFSRPLVTSADAVLGVTVEPGGTPAVLGCDGRRTVDVAPGSTVRVRRGTAPVRVVRIDRTPFTDRLVTKFDLPVDGWRRHREG